MTFNITILSVGVVLAMAVLLLPILGCLLSFLIGALWAFVWRSKLPPNWLYARMKFLRIKPTEPIESYTVVKYSEEKGTYILVRCRDDRVWDFKYNLWCCSADEYCPVPLDRANVKLNELEELEGGKPEEYFDPFLALSLVALAVITTAWLLHYAFWLTLYVASFVGAMFVLRWICDLQKYAKKVKEGLDKHISDPKAHSSEAMKND